MRSVDDMVIQGLKQLIGELSLVLTHHLNTSPEHVNEYLINIIETILPNTIESINKEMNPPPALLNNPAPVVNRPSTPKKNAGSLLTGRTKMMFESLVKISKDVKLDKYVE